MATPEEMVAAQEAMSRAINEACQEAEATLMKEIKEFFGVSPPPMDPWEFIRQRDKAKEQD